MIGVGFMYLIMGTPSFFIERWKLNVNEAYKTINRTLFWTGALLVFAGVLKRFFPSPLWHLVLAASVFWVGIRSLRVVNTLRKEEKEPIG